MLTIWKQRESLIEVEKFERNCWVNVTKPTSSEIERLISEFRIPDDFINDILDIDERSRTESELRWLLIILRIPVFGNQEGIPYMTVPLGILISPHSIITISQFENEIINGILHPVRAHKIKVENKINFVLEIFLRTSLTYLKYLKDINIKMTAIEKDLERSMKNRELENMLKMEKCLVFFATSLKSNELLLQKLRHLKYGTSPELNLDLLDDVVIETSQAIEMTQIYSNIQANLMDVFASVISNNMNHVIKQLTSVTIILMIPTLISSYYGMNLKNHMESSNYGFFIVLIVSIVVAIVGVYIFRKRNWF